MESFGLKLPETAEEDTNYDDNANAAISNEFATVAFCFAHGNPERTFQTDAAAGVFLV